MTERQKRFCEYYAASGNAADAARMAGYSHKTARSQGQRLLTNVDILKYIRRLQDELAAPRVASLLQVQAYWSSVLHDSTAKTADRLKAGELLAKAAGAFVHARGDDGGVWATGECGGEDVVIFMPQLQDESEVQADDED